MVSQLLANDKISFVVAKPFSSRGKDYQVGDDFDQDEARDIEVFVRSRYVIPVVDSIEDKQHIRHWHRHIRPKDEVLERLARDRTQLVLPIPPDSDEVVNLELLTHPEQTPPADDTQDSDDAPEVGEDSGPEPEAEFYDPGVHTVTEVLEYMDSHPEDRVRVVEAEVAGKNRKGMVEGY